MKMTTDERAFVMLKRRKESGSQNRKTGSEELHMENDINDNNQTYINLKNNTSELRNALDYFTFLGNCPATRLGQNVGLGDGKMGSFPHGH